MNTEIQRDHEGTMHLAVDGVIASGSKVTGIQNIDGVGLTAIVWVPMRYATLGETRNVVPMLRVK